MNPNVNMYHHDIMTPGESLPAVMLAPGSIERERKSGGRGDHGTAAHGHHHPMVGRVYSFDASLVGAKVAGPLPPNLASAVSKGGNAPSFYGVSVGASPPPSVTGSVQSSSGVSIPVQNSTSNNSLSASSKKARLDSSNSLNASQTSQHTSPTTTPPGSSGSSATPPGGPPPPLRCTLCNG